MRNDNQPKSRMSYILELFDKDFNIVIIKMLKQSTKNSLGTSEKIEKSQQRKENHIKKTKWKLEIKKLTAWTK